MRKYINITFRQFQTFVEKNIHRWCWTNNLLILNICLGTFKIIFNVQYGAQSTFSFSVNPAYNFPFSNSHLNVYLCSNKTITIDLMECYATPWPLWRESRNL